MKFPLQYYPLALILFTACSSYNPEIPFVTFRDSDGNVLNSETVYPAVLGQTLQATVTIDGILGDSEVDYYFERGTQEPQLIQGTDRLRLMGSGYATHTRRHETAQFSVDLDPNEFSSGEEIRFFVHFQVSERGYNSGVVIYEIQ